MCGRFHDFIRHGADGAKLLRDDEIGSESFEQCAIEMIETRPGVHRAAAWRSISPADVNGSAEEAVSFGSAVACCGKSHSCVTPTTSSPAPTAKSISVALGSRLTMRIRTPSPKAELLALG